VPARWDELERAAPELAGRGRERLEQARVALLGTLRRDGAPRISPVEPHLSGGHLLFGAMAWTLKARDLLRDPRCVLHSAVTGPDAGEAELKLYGHAFEADAAVRDACTDGWWSARPPDDAAVFELAIEEATLIEWDLGAGELMVRRWSEAAGYRERRRNYP
jgi:hypothetical protein